MIENIFEAMPKKKKYDEKDMIFDEFLDHLGRWLPCRKDGSGSAYSMTDYARVILISIDTKWEYYLCLERNTMSEDQKKDLKYVHLNRNKRGKKIKGLRV